MKTETGRNESEEKGLNGPLTTKQLGKQIGPLQIREKMNKSPLCEDTQYCHYHHQVLIGHVQNT